MSTSLEQAPIISADDLLNRFQEGATIYRQYDRLTDRIKHENHLAVTAVGLEVPDDILDNQKANQFLNNLPDASREYLTHEGVFQYFYEVLANKLSTQLSSQEQSTIAEYAGRKVRITGNPKGYFTDAIYKEYEETRALREVPIWFASGVSGSISGIDFRNNALYVKPRKFSPFNLDHCHFVAKVINQDTFDPLIDIEFLDQ